MTKEPILDAICEGAVQRVRPKAMTVAVILAGLLPIMFGHGAGSEVMQRIAAPMVAGMITAPLLSLFVISAAWRLLQERRLRRREGIQMRLYLYDDEDTGTASSEFAKYKTVPQVKTAIREIGCLR